MASNAPERGSVAAAPGTDPTPTASVTVRYWAAARAAAGTDSDAHAGATVGEVVDAAASAHPGLERVTRVATFLLDGRKVGRDEPVAAGATVEVLPPFAGG